MCAPDIMSATTSSSHSAGKRRITKTEKIAELQGKLKILQNDNRQLVEDAERKKMSDGLGSGSSHHKSVSTKERDKLKEALRTLKRVTVKQEVSLATLRQKSKERRREIEHKDKIIKKLDLENMAFRKAHERMQDDNDGDVSTLRSKLADLQLKLASEESSKAEQSEKLREREAGISSLQAMLADAKGRGVARTTSSDSAGLSMMSESTAGEDMAKLKKQLAQRSEKITNLQHELDICKDEIHDLKQRNQFTNAFPATPAAGELDFFDDNGDEEDLWTGF